MTVPSTVRLLVIDDDARFPDYLRVLLRACATSFVIEVAATIADALRVLSRGSHDVCLLDYRLGDEDGLEVLQRAQARGLRTPIVLLTGEGSESLALTAIKLGAADYLDKSEIDPRRLERTLTRAIARHRADMALREREVRLADAEAFAHVMVAHFSLDGRWLKIPRRFSDLLGYGNEELMALRVADVTYPDDLARLAEQQHALMAGSARSIEVETRYVRKGGGFAWVYQNSSLVTTEDGTALYFLTYLRDITNQKRAEEALRASEQRYSSMVRNAPYGIFEATYDGRFLTVNPALVSMLAVESEQQALVIDPDHLYGGAGVRRSVLSDLISNGPNGVETRWVRADNSALLVHVCAHAVAGDRGVITGVVEDISQRKQLEDQLRQVHKMEAIGQLAGGVAHDFNNLLTAILGYTELLKDRCSDIPDVCLDLEQVESAGKSAAALTSQLLAFSRKQVLKPEVVSVHAVIGRMQSLLSRILGEDISLVTRAEVDVPPVEADPVQLQQVILNLAINARDAMPLGGKLTIETTSVDADDAPPSMVGLSPGYYVMVRVRDTGCGMDAATQAHIFEPFFTTKSVGKGTGLGLATVYGIVKQSGGDVICESVPAGGTTFTILLPAADVPSGRVARQTPQLATGSGTVLLVEDQPIVRRLTRRFLEAAGYRVLDTGEPQAAFGLAQETDIDLLVTDVVMPNMSGPDLARRIRTFKPSLPVLFMSGFAGHSALDEVSGAPFLRKPFTPGELTTTAASLLKAQSEAEGLESAL